jgi:hypothetical protein
MGGGAPSKGTIVSGKLRAKSRKRKHEKQYWWSVSGGGVRPHYCESREYEIGTKYILP